MKKTFLFCILTLITHITFAETTTSVFEDFSKLKKAQPISTDYNETLRTEVNSYFNNAPAKFDKNLSQYFIVVDSAVKKQNLMLAYWDSTTKTFQLSPSMTQVSTGRTGSSQHFITPTGWVEQIPENGTYRAEGTKNKNGIRGYGVKGMRVWDFGWQNATTGWLKKPEIRQIRMQMHATDPQYLEQRLGTPASQGCLRLSAETNLFLDKYSIIDRNIENSKLAWTLKKERTPVTNEGSFVLVINTTLSANSSTASIASKDMAENNKVKPSNLTPTVIIPEGSSVNTNVAPTNSRTSSVVKEK